ncbi:hypothetical protein [Pseudaquidulcibacter saccharophilus]|uniref:hypothetical protein n=1 Tax=Pseudaquidulcibacter saccharophilus TaxID=2831900 RepID=UPI001EFF5417|nr:hypothetical protein [Pseudaquidulcibacter saccharophilus]
MEQSLLNWLRFITPGIIILLYWALTGQFLQTWQPSWPQTMEQWKAPPIHIFIAMAYYAFSPRNEANKAYFNKVTENLRAGLIKISGRKLADEGYEWNKVRSIFFHFIDEDKSLSNKAKNAYFNGWVWTSLADLRAISAIYAFLFFIAMLILQSKETIELFAISILTALFSIPASRSVTERHIEIGIQQLEIIELKYSDKLKELFKKLEEKNGN